MGYYEAIASPQKIPLSSIMVLGDLVSCNQDIIANHFCFGHKYTDYFYFSSIPKQLNRDNANKKIFKHDMTNHIYVYNDHVSVNMSSIALKNLCSLNW